MAGGKLAVFAYGKEENEKYNTIEKMINALESTGINYDKSNYFVKKAKIIFEEKYRNN